MRCLASTLPCRAGIDHPRHRSKQQSLPSGHDGNSICGGRPSRYRRVAMSRELGQNILIENVSGAGGTIGATCVARAKPDGYTILMYHIRLGYASGALPVNRRAILTL